MEPTKPIKNPSIGKAAASLVFGVIAIICAFLGLGAFLGVILGLIGFILGRKAQKESPSVLARAGIMITILAIVICGIGIWNLRGVGVAVAWQ
ncbi:hypothetical protein [Caproicibacter fermentans]|uniref:DUF4190 domain-containing protein n=1 Tax=Caproicibacter fermentans TaxID=2576756 RepID=A0A7G8T7R1_9FIRM|nr:hypothetical protein [Caproicibacter fermentans]QNK39652.1 hypothetical protein HCR03_13030 [Caproicibacter fermentans]